MDIKGFKPTRNQLIAGGLALALVGAAFYMHSLGTKVSYYTVKQANIEKLETVNGRTLPVEPSVLSIGQDGILVTALPEVGTAVSSGEVIAGFKGLSLMDRLIQNQTEWEGIGSMLKLSGEGADPGSKAGEAYKEWQGAKEELNERIKAHESVLGLLKQQMVANADYNEALELLNEALIKYLDKSVALKNRMSEMTALSSAEASFEVAVGHLEALLAARDLILQPVVDGKSVEANAVEGVIAIKAPKQGIITRAFGKPNQFLPVGTPVIEIANLGEIMVTFDVPLSYLDDLKLGTAVRIKGGDAKIYNGKVNFIDSQITDQMNADGSIEKFVSVKAKFNDASSVKLYEKQSISIVLNHAENALIVPLDLLIKRDGKYYVRYNDQGTLKEKEVTLSFEVGNQAVISSGVQLGEKIVVDTTLNLGQKISYKD